MSNPSPAPSAWHLCSFSGGKDSVAQWLYCERELGLKVVCVFADTGHESVLTYNYLDELVEKHKCPLVRVVPRLRDMWEKDPPARIDPSRWDEELDMRKLILEKGRPPSATARFCTTVLKLKPLRRYRLEHFASADVLMCSGVRAEESDKRAEMAPVAYDEFMRCQRWLPIQEWTVEQVFDIHRRYDIPINPLYLRGCARVGCFPCIFARKAELAIVAKEPEAVTRLKQIEADSGQTFFASKVTSQKYRSDVDSKSGKRISWADDVFRWATGAEPALKSDGLYADQHEEMDLDVGEDIEAAQCSSVYGLCE